MYGHETWWVGSIENVENFEGHFKVIRGHPRSNTVNIGVWTWNLVGSIVDAENLEVVWVFIRWKLFWLLSRTKWYLAKVVFQFFFQRYFCAFIAAIWFIYIRLPLLCSWVTCPFATRRAMAASQFQPLAIATITAWWKRSWAQIHDLNLNFICKFISFCLYTKFRILDRVYYKVSIFVSPELCSGWDLELGITFLAGQPSIRSSGTVSRNPLGLW